MAEINLDYIDENSKSQFENCIFNSKKNTKKLKIKVVKKGIVIPYKITNSDIAKGGVVDSTGKFVRESFYDGGWVRHGGIYDFDVDKIMLNNKEVVYIGFFTTHFGHFLIDAISRCWYLCQSASEDLYIAYVGLKEMAGVYLEFFELLGIKPSNIIWIRHPTQFENVYIPEQSNKPNCWYTNQYYLIYKKIVSNVIKENNKEHLFKDKKIYFTRTKFRDARKKEVGERFLEMLYENNGYVIISPEKCSLKEIICRLNECEEVACVNGTLPFYIMFSNRFCKWTILNKTNFFHENIMDLISFVDNPVCFIDVFHPRHKGGDLGLGPFYISYTNHMKKYCEDNDLKALKYSVYYKFWCTCKWYILFFRRKARNILKPIKRALMVFASKYN